MVIFLGNLPDIGLIMLIERVTFLLALLSRSELQAINDVLIDFHYRHTKPLLVISPPGGIYEETRVTVEKRLLQAGIPIYPSFEHASKAVANIVGYWRFRDRIQGSLSH